MKFDFNNKGGWRINDTCTSISTFTCTHSVLWIMLLAVVITSRCATDPRIRLYVFPSLRSTWTLTNIAVTMETECARRIPMARRAAGSAALRHNDTSIRLHQNPANQMFELPTHVFYSQILGVLWFQTSCFLLAQWLMHPRGNFHTAKMCLLRTTCTEQSVLRVSFNARMNWFRLLTLI